MEQDQPSAEKNESTKTCKKYKAKLDNRQNKIKWAQINTLKLNKDCKN